MVTMGARLLVNSRDQELNLLHSILFSPSKEGSNTSVSITASDNDDSRLELADGTVISGSSLIAERLLRESHSTLDLFGVSELDYAEVMCD
jgi:hypothetical protein